MNLLIGCSSPPDIGAGGILTYTKEIVESFLEGGHNVFIAAPEPKDWGWINDNNINFIETCQYKDPIESTSKLIKFSIENKIEGIINNDNPYVQSMLPAMDCPSIVIGHLGESVIATLACYQSEWTDYVVTISNDMFSTYVQKYKVPVTKCPIVFNGVKDSGCKGDLSNINKKLKVVFAGGFNKRKGCLSILSAVSEYSERFDNIELNWFGNIPDKVAKELKQYSFVNVRGKVSRKKFLEEMIDADALLFPSKSEGCPMAMLEAMSLGVVPIASDGIGAMSSLITNAKEGYICHLDNWHDQATQCMNLLNGNRAILSDMKYAVREVFLQRFQRENVTKQLLSLLKKPTVKRENRIDKVDVLHWHRPVPRGKSKATLINRVRFKLGLIKKAGILRL